MRRDAIFACFVLLLLVLLYGLYVTRPWEPRSVEQKIFFRYVDKNERIYNQFLDRMSQKLETEGFARCHHPEWRGCDYPRQIKGLSGDVYWFGADFEQTGKAGDPVTYRLYLRLERFPAPLYAFRLSAVMKDSGRNRLVLVSNSKMAEELNGWAQDHDADLTEDTVAR